MFQAKLDNCKRVNPSTKWNLTLKLLEDLDDGSKAHFLGALQDEAISAPAIVQTLKEVIGVEVNRSTISEWRKNNERISKASN
jgi:hypothetical protein|tara:strand:+ start:470 stop:718 length:249 start_codon:yes stop_codon:yes gene_type:complete